MRWPEIWHFIRSWKGIVSSVVAVAAALFYGPKKVLEVWDWYLERFRDRHVWGILKNRTKVEQGIRFNPYKGMHGGLDSGSIEMPWSVKDIAETLNRSERSVSKSLSRLEDQDRAERYQGGWRLKT
jgi:hypothetical protein